MFDAPRKGHQHRWNAFMERLTAFTVAHVQALNGDYIKREIT